MEYIADAFWKEKQKIIVYSFIEQHYGRENSRGHDWYLVKHNWVNYYDCIYLWEDGRFHYDMNDGGDTYHYFETQQAARDCCIKYGFEPVDY